MLRFRGINFQGSSKIHKNSEIYFPQKFPAIWYVSASHISLVMEVRTTLNIIRMPSKSPLVVNILLL